MAGPRWLVHTQQADVVRSSFNMGTNVKLFFVFLSKIVCILIQIQNHICHSVYVPIFVYNIFVHKCKIIFVILQVYFDFCLRYFVY